MNGSTQTWTRACACVILTFLACSSVNPGTWTASTPTPISGNIGIGQITPTPTPGPIILPGVPGVEPPPPGGAGEIEMRTRDMLNPDNEDCVSRFPFTMNWETDPPTITGEGSVDCHFQSPETPTHHAVMKYAVTVQGGITSGDGGGERLLAELIFDGSLSQYDTGVPSGAYNPFPESNPAVITEKGPYPPLDFEYVDGATITMTLGQGTRDFILHLTK